jgi:XTP/dITP diphosphohydrolase
MKIFFGTNNPGKLREIQDMLGEQFEVLSFRDLDEPIDVEETEHTFEGNAALKARAFYEHTGLPCFADDSGLEVDALGGAPGVYSARYSGPDATNESNNARLIKELEGETQRTARYRVVIAFYDGETMSFFEGKVEGEILESPRGEGGFGYDPYFKPAGYDVTFAEMPAEEKHKISHRGKAVKALVSMLNERA